MISLELGYGLIPMVDADTGGRLLNRLKGIRKKLSAEMGFLLPSIRIRDNLDSAPDAYQIVINGSVRGVGVIAGGKRWPLILAMCCRKFQANRAKIRHLDLT